MVLTMSPAAGRKIVSPRMDKSARPPVEIFRNEFVEILKDAEVSAIRSALGSLSGSGSGSGSGSPAPRLRLRLRLRLSL